MIMLQCVDHSRTLDSINTNSHTCEATQLHCATSYRTRLTTLSRAILDISKYALK